MAPACSRRAMLEDHHIRFRSRGGSNELWNRGQLCLGHHEYGVHRNRICMTGRAPDKLLWDFAPDLPGGPFLRLRGERYVGPRDGPALIRAPAGERARHGRGNNSRHRPRMPDMPDRAAGGSAQARATSP